MKEIKRSKYNDYDENEYGTFLNQEHDKNKQFEINKYNVNNSENKVDPQNRGFDIEKTRTINHKIDLKVNDEENLDLDLSKANQKVWFVKLPQYLGDKLFNVDEFGGQEIGKILIKKGESKDSKFCVKLILDKKFDKEEIPLDYDISILNTQVRNQYVFNEKVTYNSKTEYNELAQLPEFPQFQMKQDENNPDYEFFPGMIFKDNKTPQIKIISKKTALVGKICNDCQVIPVKNDVRYKNVISNIKKMGKITLRPKVTFLDEIPGVAHSNAGPSIKGSNISLFMKSNKNRNDDGKAVRIPKKDLLDLLFKLFEEQEFWSIKNLKEKTKQPEHYLKKCLEAVGILIKKGPYALKYCLKPEYKNLRNSEQKGNSNLNIITDYESRSSEDDGEMEFVI